MTVLFRKRKRIRTVRKVLSLRRTRGYGSSSREEGSSPSFFKKEDLKGMSHEEKKGCDPLAKKLDGFRIQDKGGKRRDSIFLLKVKIEKGRRARKKGS